HHGVDVQAVVVVAGEQRADQAAVAEAVAHPHGEHPAGRVGGRLGDLVGPQPLAGEVEPVGAQGQLAHTGGVGRAGRRDVHDDAEVVQVLLVGAGAFAEFVAGGGLPVAGGAAPVVV